MGRDEKVESWQKVKKSHKPGEKPPPPKPMKVLKTMIRTKSGRMVSGGYHLGVSVVLGNTIASI